MIDERLVIKTNIPDEGVCFVTLNDTPLSAEDAIKLGEQITLAGRRAYVLNRVLAAWSDGPTGPRQFCRNLIRFLK